MHSAYSYKTLNFSFCWKGMNRHQPRNLKWNKAKYIFKIRGCMITYGDTLHKNYTATHPEDRKQASCGQD